MLVELCVICSRETGWTALTTDRTNLSSRGVRPLRSSGGLTWGDGCTYDVQINISRRREAVWATTCTYFGAAACDNGTDAEAAAGIAPPVSRAHWKRNERPFRLSTGQFTNGT